MRPDRIVVGECRGAEAFDMLTAMNTGHEGSLTTLHANSPRDALARLEAMILMAGLDLPLPAVREHIAASVDIVVQQARLADGRRLVTSVVEVAGMESGRIQLQDLFRYDRTQGFLGCGGLPSFAQEWAEAGAAFEAAWFSDAGGRGPETTVFPQGLP
ncbi:putative conjugal transfer protein [compost metagenome]